MISGYLCLGLRPHFGSRGQVARPFVSDTSPNVLTKKAWEDAVQGLGKREI